MLTCAGVCIRSLLWRRTLQVILFRLERRKKARQNSHMHRYIRMAAKGRGESERLGGGWVKERGVKERESARGGREGGKERGGREGGEGGEGGNM